MNKVKIIGFCDKAAEVSVWFVAFSFAISIAMTNVFLGLLIFFWFMKRLLTKNFIPPQNPLNYFFVFLFGISLYSMANSVEMSSSMGGITRLFKCLVFFLALIDTVNDKEKLKRVVLTILLGLLFISIDGVFQYFTGKDFIRGRNYLWIQELPGSLYKKSFIRLTASMKFSNVFACYLVTVIPLALSSFLYYLKGKKRLISSLLVILAIFCMFNTIFRGAGLAFITVLLLFSIIKKDIRLVVALVIIAVCLPFILPRTVLKWILANPNPIDLFIEQGGRRWHWLTALNMIKAHPFIGVGIKTFLNNYALYKYPLDPYIAFNAHNSYLHLAAETGLIGFSIFMAMIGAVIVHWRKAYIKIKTTDLQAISLGLFGGFVAFLTVSIMDSFLQSSNMTVLFYFILGLLIASNMISQKLAQES